jgi:uncharacterized protein (TIGR04255 family)
MGTVTIDKPFGPAVEEIPLSRSPLVSVIAQIRFQAVMAIQGDPAFAAPFQEALRKDYPVLRQERQMQILIGPSGGLPQDAGVLLRFEQQDPDAWQVTLAPSFVALSTKKRYVNRSDFLTRLTIVLHALKEWLGPKVCDRIGVRYIDRVGAEHLPDLPKLVRSEVLGVTGSESDSEVEVVHTLADTLFHLSDASELRSRWGIMPVGGTYDPAVEPFTERSWVLDLDHYTSETLDFELAPITERVTEFCDRIYRFFRWAVTEDFLESFGAER